MGNIISLFHRAADPDRPSYVLTDRLDASIKDVLLGRIVRDYRSPADNYRPIDPRPALVEGTLEIQDTEFSLLFSHKKNRTAAAKVGHIVSVDFDKLKNESYTLKSSFVRTR